MVYLYATNKDDQYAFIDAAKEKGYDVLLMDGQLDIPWMGLIEHKTEKTRFVRVDSNTIEHLIEKEETEKVDLTDKEKEALSEIVKSQLPKMDKTEFVVEFKALEENSKPIQIIQDEFSRRMKEMAEIQPGMSFYSDMPNIYQVVVNTRHPLIKEIVDETADKEKEALLQYASENKKIKQMIDLALLSNSMLKGEALSDFIKRSIEMM